jgi:hypothetical protein
MASAVKRHISQDNRNSVTGIAWHHAVRLSMARALAALTDAQKRKRRLTAPF